MTSKLNLYCKLVLQNLMKILGANHFIGLNLFTGPPAVTYPRRMWMDPISLSKMPGHDHQEFTSLKGLGYRIYGYSYTFNGFRAGVRGRSHEDMHFSRGSYLISFTVSTMIPRTLLHDWIRQENGRSKKRENFRLLHRLFSDSCAEWSLHFCSDLPESL